MKAANDLPLHPAYLLNGEPTTGALGRSQKGMARFHLSATGVAGHSGTPAAGASAVHALTSALAALLASPPLPPPTTLNVGTVTGGTAANVIAADAAAGVMLRLAPGVTPDAATAAVTAAVDGAVGAWRVDEAARGGGGSVLYGVGDIRVAHTADEAIAVADMERGVGVYADLVEELLGMVTAAADQ